jgi:excisionase family DNA binding protein
MTGGPHILYRVFNAENDLLYIGITNDVVHRFKGHAKTAIWWRDMASYTTECGFASRHELELAELAAIKDERPMYNTVNNPYRQQHPIEFEQTRTWACIAQALATRQLVPAARVDSSEDELGDSGEPPRNTWLSRDEVAARLRVPKSTTESWASEGKGPRFAKFGRHVRYRLADVVAWENEQLGDAS